MKIVFWSPVSGKCSVSSTTVAMATYMSLMGDADCSILPLNCHNKGAQYAFISQDGSAQLARTVGGFGVDALLMSLDGGFSSGNVSSAALQIHSHLDYYPSTSNPRISTIEKQLSEKLDKILTTFEEKYEYNFIDAGSGLNDVTAKVLTQADLLVICVNQSISTVNELFDMCNLENIPCIYLVTNYDKTMQLTPRNFSVQYKLMTPLNVFVLPHCAKFANSVNNSDTLKFMTVNASKGKLKLDSETKYFFDSLKKFSTRISKGKGNK